MDLTLQFPGLFEIEVQTRTLQTRKFKVRTNSVMESFFISKNFSLSLPQVSFKDIKSGNTLFFQ